MALVNPCNLEDNVVNTGVDCDSAMGPTKKLFMVPVSDRFTQADITAVGTFSEYATSRTHDVPGRRWFPLFGSYAPINDIQDATEGDVIETLPDGSKALVRRGFYNRTFLTTKGGDCFANILIRFPRGFAFIEVDEDEKVKMYEPSTGVYGGFPTALAYGMSPTLATLTTVFKNGLYLSYNAVTYNKNGKLFASTATEDILSINGLLDSAISNFSAPVAASNTAPTGSTTITTAGSIGDTIQLSINGVDVSGTVTRSGSQTAAQFATAVAAAISALVATNGGITAAATGAQIDYTIPASFGASLNTLSAVATIVGAITATQAAFTGGVWGAVTFQLNVDSECSETNLVAAFPGTTAPGLVIAGNFAVTRSAVTVTPTVSLVSVSGSPDHIQMVVPASSVGDGAIAINGAAANVLYANGVIGYDIISGITY
jgi:hypothetical protein